MSEATDAAPLIEAQKLRDAAHALVRQDIDFIRDGLAARPIPQRVKDSAVEKLVDTAEVAGDIAAENKGIIAGTALAILAWMLRGPIIDGIESGIEKLKEWGPK